MVSDEMHVARLPSQGRRLRWGVLGTARTAEKRTLPAMHRATDNAIQHEVVAIAGRNAEKLDRFNRQFRPKSIYPWHNAHELLENPDVEAIYVPLPNALHAEWTVRSLEAGKHVLCEKPIALDSSEIRRIIAAARSNDRVVEENFSYHLTPGYRYLKDICRSNETASMDSIIIRFCFRATREHRVRYERVLGGGSFLDLGCYGIDFIHRFLNESIEIAHLDADPPLVEQASWGGGPGCPVDVTCRVRGKTSSGVAVEIYTSFVDDAQQSLKVCMKKGDAILLPTAFRVERASSDMLHNPGGEDVARRHFTRFDTDSEMLNAFARKVFGRKPLDPPQIWRWEKNADLLEHIRTLVLEQIDQ